MSHELITAASLLYARRLRPGIGFHAARALIAGYAADPARLDDLAQRIAAFRLACCFERLKRAGRFEDVRVGDPFDPEGAVSVTLTEAEWRSVNRDSAPRGPAPGATISAGIRPPLGRGAKLPAANSPVGEHGRLCWRVATST